MRLLVASLFALLSPEESLRERVQKAGIQPAFVIPE